MDGELEAMKREAWESTGARLRAFPRGEPVEASEELEAMEEGRWEKIVAQKAEDTGARLRAIRELKDK